MMILNFSHPLTSDNLGQLAQLLNFEVDQLEVKNIRVQMNLESSFVPQIKDIVASVGLSSTEWQNNKIIVNLPGMSPATGVLLAELHGRMGYFPTIMRLSSMQVAPPVFGVAEVIGLQNVRNEARLTR